MDSVPDLAVVGGTVYAAPAQEPIRDAVVLVGGKRILEVGTRAQVRIPDGVRTIDCAGRVITAAFWNSHVHFFERKWADAATMPVHDLARQLQDFTRYGFTSVFDLSSPWRNTQSLRERIESGEVRGPRIRSTGEGLVPPDTAPSRDVCNVMGVMETPLPEVRSALQAADAARSLLDQGADGIKLFASSPRGATLVEGAIEAAADVAHRLAVRSSFTRTARTTCRPRFWAVPTSSHIQRLARALGTKRL